MTTWTELYINGRWQAPKTQDTIEVFDSFTEDVMGVVPGGGEADAVEAVLAARAAFPAWTKVPLAERIALVNAMADGLTAREDELSKIMAREVGSPIATALRVQVGLAVNVFKTMAEAAEHLDDEERIGNSLILRQPVGVVGAITPWNYPLYQLAAKVGPALLTGCTVVVKPSSVAPLATFVLAQIADEIGIPAGVFNLVSGRGAVVGEVLSGHPEVDMVSITGSTGAGARVAEVAAKTIKKVGLELGGKSAFLLAPGADLDAALSNAVRGCFVNNGQTCSATTRLLVPSDLLGEVEERVAAAVNAMTVGDPLDPTTDIGPIASSGQQRTVAEYIEMGDREGTTIAGGPGRPEGFDKGYFVRPTAISRLSPDARVVQEEIFGPVLSIVPYKTLDEGIAIANNCEYGLSGAVYAADIPAAVEIAKQMRTGQVAINGGRFNAKAPFGGFKASGIGRELGHHGLMEYTELISLQFPSVDDLGNFGTTV